MATHFLPAVSRRRGVLYGTTHVIFPIAFFIHFFITGTVVLVYTLCLHETLPAKYIIGAASAFGILISLILIGHLSIYCRRRLYPTYDASPRNSEKSYSSSDKIFTRIKRFLVNYELASHKHIREWKESRQAKTCKTKPGKENFRSEDIEKTTIQVLDSRMSMMIRNITAVIQSNVTLAGVNHPIHASDPAGENIKGKLGLRQPQTNRNYHNETGANFSAMDVQESRFEIPDDIRQSFEMDGTDHFHNANSPGSIKPDPGINKEGITAAPTQSIQHLQELDALRTSSIHPDDSLIQRHPSPPMPQSQKLNQQSTSILESVVIPKFPEPAIQRRDLITSSTQSRRLSALHSFTWPAQDQQKCLPYHGSGPASDDTAILINKVKEGLNKFNERHPNLLAPRQALSRPYYQSPAISFTFDPYNSTPVSPLTPPSATRQQVVTNVESNVDPCDGESCNQKISNGASSINNNNEIGKNGKRMIVSASPPTIPTLSYRAGNLLYSK